jgi:hypothetical protein
VCCQDFPGAAIAGSATCKFSCSSSIPVCRTDDECCPHGSQTGGHCVPQMCTNQSPVRTMFVQACGLGSNAAGTLSSSCTAMQ